METDHTDSDGNLDLQRAFLVLTPELKGWFSASVADHALVDDLVQETFLVVVRKQHTFEPGTNFRAWVFAIARFKLLNASRKSANREVCLSDTVLELILSEDAPESSWDARLEFLQHCLKKLSPRARQVIELRYYSDMSPREISGAIDWTIGAVNVALTRARQVLAKCVASEQRFHNPQPPVES